jgi:hypothetical protein
MIRTCGLMVALLGLAGGCLNEDPGTRQVAANPFGNPPPQPTPVRTSFAPAALEAAARVDSVGRQLLEANKQIGVKPLFRTIGAPQPEVFHQGTDEVDVTEGLVKQCASDGQLAAVLALELGKMIAQREATVGPQARLAERQPPMDVRVGNDNTGSFGPADHTHLAELGKYERDHPRAGSQPPPAPDPQALARGYLTKAGYAATELEAAQPALQAAAENNTFAKQLSPAPSTARSWTR